jgi:hypothetical protein
MNCLRIAMLAATVSFGLVSGAHALPITYNLDKDLNTIGTVERVFLDVTLGGKITLDDAEFSDFGPGGTLFKPLTDFDFELTFDIDLGNVLAPVRIPITPNTASVVLNGQTTRADENAITIDAFQAPGFTPLFEIQVDKFVDKNGQPTDFGFPNGQRLGDDVNDLLLIQLFKGSINLGVAAFTDGISAPPGLIEVKQLTSGDNFTLATASNDVSVVPLPPTLPLSTLALGLMAWTSRRRRAV